MLLIMAVILGTFGIVCLARGEMKITNTWTLRGDSLRPIGITLLVAAALTIVLSLVVLRVAQDHLWAMFVPFAPALIGAGVAMSFALRARAVGGEAAMREKASVRLLLALSNLTFPLIIVALIALLTGLFPLFEGRSPTAPAILTSCAGVCLLCFAIWLNFWARRNGQQRR